MPNRIVRDIIAFLGLLDRGHNNFDSGDKTKYRNK